MRGKGADRFQYELTIEDAGGRHELRWARTASPTSSAR
jgi:hypothetical protein